MMLTAMASCVLAACGGSAPSDDAATTLMARGGVHGAPAGAAQGDIPAPAAVALPPLEEEGASATSTATVADAGAAVEPQPEAPALTAATVTTSLTASAPIDAIIAAMPSNSWKALPNTKMSTVCPQPYAAFTCESVMAAWSGGAYDTVRDRMVVYGGGHADSWYNNVFAFDLPNMKWARLSEMGGGATGTSPGLNWRDGRLESCGFYPKGTVSLPSTVMNSTGTIVEPSKCFTEPVLSQLDLQQPRSSHTYGGVFVDVKGRYCSIGETYYINARGSRVSICFDPVTARWSRIADRPSGVGGRGQTAVDAKGHVWSMAGESGRIGQYDPVANTWKVWGYNNYDAGGGMDIDRKRHHAYVLRQNSDGTYVTRRWDLNNATTLASRVPYTNVVTTGTPALGKRPGFAYADRLDRFYAWGGGRDVHVFDPATATWKKLTPGGDDPGLQLKWGTYGRFRYSPSRGVFVLANGTTKDVYIYKP